MNLMKNILVTGGAGFIGSNFIRYWMGKYPEDRITNFDALTYAGNPENLRDIENNENYYFIKGNICDLNFIDNVFEENKPDFIVNFAAESHNSYAILNPSRFAATNTMGTVNLLEIARKHKDYVKRFHHISTCEVYGDLDLDSKEKFTEKSPLLPNTPYNGSKAAADIFVRVYSKTFNLPITVSNCGNNYGPYQHPEKLIPRFVTNLLEGKKVPVYKSSQNRREWIHVLDHCRALDLILNKGRVGESYNVGSGIEKSIEEITEIILQGLNQPESMKMYVEDRPSHDRRYLLDCTKIRDELGWKPEISFESGIKETIDWYRKNEAWWKPLKEKDFIQEDRWKMEKTEK